MPPPDDRSGYEALTDEQRAQVRFLGNCALEAIDHDEYEEVYLVWRWLPARGDAPKMIEVVLMPVRPAPISQGNMGHGTPEDPMMAYSTGVH